MSNIFLYSFLSVLPLILGSLLGSLVKIKEKIVGDIAAFGAGAMLAALTFGLMEESFKLSGIDNAIIGFLIGGILFVVGDLIIIKIGGRGHKRVYSAEESTGYGIVLSALLDGIPESIGLGISLIVNPKIGLLFLIGIMLNNFPEAVSSAYDLKKFGQSTKKILKIWFGAALVIFLFAIIGFTMLSGISTASVATIQAVAAGAVLAMLASTMMPEAYKESGLNASLATILGFLLIFVLSKTN